MSELLVETPDRLEFSIVSAGDLLTITTGQQSEAWRYGFEVQERQHLWPSGQLTATSPNGEEVGPLPFELHGCGRWTTQRQNPVQKQTGLAFTPYYEGLIVGSFLWGKQPGTTDRLVFDKPGQEISRITYTPYKENAMLGVLTAVSGSLTVAQVVEALPDTPGLSALTAQQVRTILSSLALRGHLEMQKNPYRFQAKHLSS